MKILVLTDFSPASQHAIDAGAALSRRFGGELVVGHVVELPPPAVVHAGPAVADGWTAEARKAAADQLEQLAARLAKGGAAVRTALADGPRIEAIAQLAREAAAELVVVGSQGRGALARLALGSFADDAADASGRPTLIVRGDATGLEGTGAGPLRIFAAIDASRPSKGVVDWLRAVRAKLPVDVTFGHCYWPPGEYHRLGLHGPRSLVDADAEVVEVLRRELEANVGVLPGEGALRWRIGPGFGRPAEWLSRWAQAAHAELIVTGTHGRHGLSRLWHSSTARDLAHVAPVPVLVVPGEASAVVKNDVPAPLRRVVAATDFSPSGDAAVRHAFSMLGAGGFLELLHVGPMHGPPSAPVAAYTEAQRADAEAQLRARIPAGLASYGLDVHVHVIDAERAGEGICQAAERLGADAIVVGTHGKTGALAAVLLGSVAMEVLRHSTRPVTVVRAPPAP